jgi:hypothetical protein
MGRLAHALALVDYQPDRPGFELIREAPPHALGFLVCGHRSHRIHLSESVYETKAILRAAEDPLSDRRRTNHVRRISRRP